MNARRSTSGLAALIATGLVACVVATLAGCSTSQSQQSSDDGAARFLVGRGKYQYYSCEQLTRQMQGLEIRRRELLALIAKAKQGPGGGFFVAVSYEPDLAVVRGDLAELHRMQAERQCPPAAPAQGTMPARRN